MIYRNIKTGAEIISKSVISAPNYILVEDNAAPKRQLHRRLPKRSLQKRSQRQ